MRMRLAALVGAGLLTLSATGAPAQLSDQVRAGLDAYSTGRFAEAADAFRTVLVSGELAPADIAVAHNNLGAALSRLGDQDAAIAEYRKAERLNPDTPMLRRNLVFAFVQRGNARAGAGQNGEAQADFDQALLISPDDVRALRGRAQLRMAAGDLIGASADLRHGLLVEPGNAELASMLEALNRSSSAGAPAAPADAGTTPAAAPAAPASASAPVAAPVQATPAPRSVVVPITRTGGAAPPSAALDPDPPAQAAPAPSVPQAAPPAAAAVPPAAEPSALPAGQPATASADMAPAPAAMPAPPPEPVAAAESPAAEPAADQAMGERFRVVAPVSVRAGPGTRFERQGTFSGGEIVVADQQEQGWYRVSRNDEPQGWVFRRWLTPVN